MTSATRLALCFSSGANSTTQPGRARPSTRKDVTLGRHIPILSLATVLAASTMTAQETSSDQTQEPESKRALGIIPNYRNSSIGSTYEPLTVGERFKVASEDSFDRGTFALAGVFAGEAQLTNANRSFGQGAHRHSAVIMARRTGISSSGTS